MSDKLGEILMTEEGQARRESLIRSPKFWLLAGMFFVMVFLILGTVKQKSRTKMEEKLSGEWVVVSPNGIKGTIFIYSSDRTFFYHLNRGTKAKLPPASAFFSGGIWSADDDSITIYHGKANNTFNRLLLSAGLFKPTEYSINSYSEEEIQLTLSTNRSRLLTLKRLNKNGYRN